MGAERNTIPLLSYQEINHKEIMSFYVREFVEDKELRKKLFYILRRNVFMAEYIRTLRENELYDDFIDACEDIYVQIYHEWVEENGLDL